MMYCGWHGQAQIKMSKAPIYVKLYLGQVCMYIDSKGCCEISMRYMWLIQQLYIIQLIMKYNRRMFRYDTF